jgi:hypothetical protein
MKLWKKVGNMLWKYKEKINIHMIKKLKKTVKCMKL